MGHIRIPLLVVLLASGCIASTVGDGVSEEPEESAADSSVPVDVDESDPPDEDAAEPGDETLLIAAAVPLLDADEVAFLAKINAYRASLGKGALRASVALTRAANVHSKEMADTGVFAHDSPDGTNTFVRIKRYYNYNTAMGENIAVGYPDAASVFQGWKNSPGHDAVMKGDYVVIGISKVLDATGRAYWTTDFGGYRDAILSAGMSTILSNSGFESTAITAGIDSPNVRTLQRWHTFATAGGTSKQRAGSQESGSYGLRMLDTAEGKAVATQIVRGASGVRYQVSGRTRHLSGPSPEYVYLDFLRSDYTRISRVTTASTLDAAWTTVTAMSDAPSGTQYVRVLLYAPAAAGTASTHDWDTIKLTAQ
jgi:uncharacterized protein YkwD